MALHPRDVSIALAKVTAAGVVVSAAIVVGVSSLTACHGKDSEKPARQFEKQTLVRAANDVRLPAKLWDLIAQGIGNEQSEFVAVKVRLIEKTHGVLGGHNREIIFGQGGGDVDLKDYVRGPGSFWLSAALIEKPVGEKLAGEGQSGGEGASKNGSEKKSEAEGEKKPEEKKEAVAAAPSTPSFKVFFLSQAKERKLEGLTYGSGCHSYFDITTYFNKAAQKEGLLGLVAQQRYVSTLSGVYFLSLRSGDRLQVAQVTVHDSRFPALTCDETKTDGANTAGAHE